MFHAFSHFFCPDQGAVGAFSYQLSDPAGVNTGALDIYCEGQNLPVCTSPESDGPGDGRGTIETDWQSPGILGCPVLFPGGPQRVLIVVAGGDETGGRSLLVSLSGSNPDWGYLVEGAHPVDANQENVLPLSCASSVSVLDVEVAFIELQFAPLGIRSDCDAGTIGGILGFCAAPFAPAVSTGPVYTRVQACGAPVDLRASLWTPTGVVPDASGRALVFVEAPEAGQCRLLGATSVIDGVESPAITAFVAGADCVNRDGDPSYTCERDCDALDCQADCDDSDPTVYPGAQETCGNGKDDDCDGRVDEEPDLDGDGIGDCVDNCPTVPNPPQNDADLDAVGDVCDNCPEIPNPDQNPAACEFVGAVDITISFDNATGKQVGTLRWRVPVEIGMLGFNVLNIDAQGRRVQLNLATIPCQQCFNGLGASYSILVPKYRGGHDLFVEILRSDGSRLLYGPAARE